MQRKRVGQGEEGHKFLALLASAFAALSLSVHALADEPNIPNENPLKVTETKELLAGLTF